MKNAKYKWIIGGVLFAILWSSAATATKVALTAAQPLIVSIVRFAVAAAVMLAVGHLVLRKPLPQKGQWRHLAVYGLLNITIYLGLYVFAMQQVTASVGALTVAVGPVMISFLSVVWLKRPLSANVIIAILVCLLGILVVAYPLLDGASVTVAGLALLLTSMLSYSIGTIYFSGKKWDNMHLFIINGWQTFFGGLFMLPIAFIGYKPEQNHFNSDFWIGTLWLALPVSIVAVAIWLWLLKKDTVKAGLWLFLSPVTGIIIAAVLMKDPINIYTVVGVLLVLAGLGISHFGRKKNRG